METRGLLGRAHLRFCCSQATSQPSHLLSFLAAEAKEGSTGKGNYNCGLAVQPTTMECFSLSVIAGEYNHIVRDKIMMLPESFICYFIIFPLCLDPFDLHHNLGAGVSRKSKT